MSYPGCYCFGMLSDTQAVLWPVPASNASVATWGFDSGFSGDDGLQVTAVIDVEKRVVHRVVPQTGANNVR